MNKKESSDYKQLSLVMHTSLYEKLKQLGAENHKSVPGIIIEKLENETDIMNLTALTNQVADLAKNIQTLTDEIDTCKTNINAVLKIISK